MVKIEKAGQKFEFSCEEDSFREIADGIADLKTHHTKHHAIVVAVGSLIAEMGRKKEICNSVLLSAAKRGVELVKEELEREMEEKNQNKGYIR